MTMLTNQVWDYGDMSGNCLFGTATMPAAQLLQSAVALEGDGQDHEHAQLQPGHLTAKSVPLEPPSGKERRRSTTSTVLGFGRAKSPGSLQVLTPGARCGV